ncbi:MAG TPA: phosphoribosylformylglycinamidine cyclo-ligase [Candidatus Polarisedimenticolaceae bacterium]|nr:phosphoribosylformylglycinamidine cyclo-ligase [Candidatus Polarisedimenticolaceae bacterium]
MTDDKPKLTYRDAGVDIDAQDEGLRRIRRLLEGTRTPGVLSELGSFGGLFALDGSIADPVLVASCDGVGTKLRVAFAAGVHDGVGRDLVHHCVNDVLVQGARPLFFLDYFATGRLDPAVLAAVVAGIAEGCRNTGCALLGGETAEMPGFYASGEYDVAGFIVGVVSRARLLDGKGVQPGDRLIGLPSAGLHTNGYSLARRICFEIAGLELHSPVAELGMTVAQALLLEHRCYLRPLEGALAHGWIRALAHVTGGGLTDNVPRVLPPGTAARIVRGSWPVPPLFSWLARTGNVGDEEMYRTFNMGIGMVVVAGPEHAAELEAHLDASGMAHRRIGEIVAGDRSVIYA